MTDLIHIDGSIGGGQVLRSALSLAALTGRAFVIDRIRSARRRPGLMRQHLTAVRAAAQICGADVRGAELGAHSVEFRPGPVRGGTYQFTIGTAGSASLVCQTVLPALMTAQAQSALCFEGGTHNPWAPPYPYLDRVYFPLLERMGVGIGRGLERPGYYPAGGGRFRVQLRPVERLTPLTLLERGAIRRLWAQADVCNLPGHIGHRELLCVQRRLDISEADLLLRTPESDGPGNAVMICAEHEYISEMTTGFGEHHVRAERVAERTADAMKDYLHSEAPVGEHLSDQLLIPLAMAGAGSFRTLRPTKHLLSNITVIERFVNVTFDVSPDERGCVVRVSGEKRG